MNVVVYKATFSYRKKVFAGVSRHFPLYPHKRTAVFKKKLPGPASADKRVFFFVFYISNIKRRR